MPLSKGKDAERKKLERNVQPDEGHKVVDVQPKSENEINTNVQPKCDLPHCIICNPEYYQGWYKKTYGEYDYRNLKK